MHFWIDKRSQTCGFSGRHRVPSSISGGGGGGFGHRAAPAFGVSGLCSLSTARNCHSQAHVKLMVTPVHRFQSIESVAGNRAQSHHQHAHHQRSHHQPQPAPRHATLVSSSSGGAAPHHSSSVPVSGSLVQDVDVGAGVYIEHPQLLQVPQVPTAAGKLKCGMWASFAIVTVFMVGAKFYFNNQSTGMEVLIFCSLLVVVLFAGCTVSLCEAVSGPQPPLSPPPLPPSLAVAAAAPQATASVPSVEELRLAADPTPLELCAQPPPPYHIAVLLPQHAPPQMPRSRHIIAPDDSDSPPPSYDKAVS